MGNSAGAVACFLIFAVMKFVPGLGGKHLPGQSRCPVGELGIVINNQGYELVRNANPCFASTAGSSAIWPCTAACRCARVRM